MPRSSSRAACVLAGLSCLAAAAGVPAVAAAQAARSGGPLFHDSHVHLTNYIQEGIRAKDLLKLMGGQVGRATLFGIPLQQQWSHRVDGDHAPTYYLETDAPLYY